MVVREFAVNEGAEGSFVKMFGPAGLWNEILRQDEGYLGSVVECASELERRYTVFDFWRSHLAFERFRQQYTAECERFSEMLRREGWVGHEVLLGMYYEPDDGEESGLVTR